MIKESLLEKLFIYNMHLGHQSSYNSQLNFYILGRRFNFYIIDLHRTFFFLKKALYFIKHLSLKNGSMLFFYSQFTNLPLLYKCMLLSVSKYSTQQIITFN